MSGYIVPPMKKRGNPAFNKGNTEGEKTAGIRKSALYAELDKLAGQEMPLIVAEVIRRAKIGDMRAAEMIMRRTWPERKGRPVDISLPAMIRNPDSILIAMDAIVQAVSMGTISPEEAEAVTSVIEAQRKAIESLNLENRIKVLEAKLPKEAMD